MKESKILIVDDESQFIKIILNILREHENYTLIVATSGEQALKTVKEYDFDLILLDIIMEPMDGYEVCRILQADERTKYIPIIFLTAKNGHVSIAKGFEAGSVDYITKPFFEDELLARVRTHIKLKQHEDEQQMKIDDGVLELQKLNKEIIATQKEVIFTLGAIGEFRSQETGQHVKRVAEYTYLLAKLSGVSEEKAQLMKMASPMHDIGKIGIADSILNKPGKLTPAEWEIMQTHVNLGYEMLRHSKRPILKMATDIALHHHEKYNGKGYPNQLQGEEISLCGRITALADVFDALGSVRPYKERWNDEDILEYIKSQSAKQFDPKLVALFFENIHQFFKIRDKYSEKE
ncbi:MAG: response regulator [Campylobacterota bacterium]|nr:response regulator [Campylobacterota bacterium]